MKSIYQTSNEAIIKAYLGTISEVEFRIKHFPDLDMMIWYHESCEPVLVQYWEGLIQTDNGTQLMTVLEAMDRYECFRTWNECPYCYETGYYTYTEGPEERSCVCEHNNRPVTTHP